VLEDFSKDFENLVEKFEIVAPLVKKLRIRK
jgi:hypothetical protein